MNDIIISFALHTVTVFFKFIIITFLFIANKALVTKRIYMHMFRLGYGLGYRLWYRLGWYGLEWYGLWYRLGHGLGYRPKYRQ